MRTPLHILKRDFLDDFSRLWDKYANLPQLIDVAYRFAELFYDRNEDPDFFWAHKDDAYKEAVSKVLKAAKPKKGVVKVAFKNEYKEREGTIYGDWAVVPISKDSKLAQVVHVRSGINFDTRSSGMTVAEAKRFLAGMMIADLDMDSLGKYAEKQLLAFKKGRQYTSDFTNEEERAKTRFSDLKHELVGDEVPKDFKIPRDYKPKPKTWEELKTADVEQMKKLAKKELVDLWNKDADGAFQDADSEFGEMLYKKLANALAMPNLFNRYAGGIDPDNLLYSAHKAGIFLNHFMAIKNPKNLDKLYERLYKASGFEKEYIERTRKDWDSEKALNTWKMLAVDKGHTPAVVQGYVPWDKSLAAVLSDGESQTGIRGDFLKLVQDEIGKDCLIKMKKKGANIDGDDWGGDDFEPVLFYQNGEIRAFVLHIRLNVLRRDGGLSLVPPPKEVKGRA